MRKAPREYHLISLDDGRSLGGFCSIDGARLEAIAEQLGAYHIYHGNTRVETHGYPCVVPACPYATAATAAGEEADAIALRIWFACASAAPTVVPTPAPVGAVLLTIKPPLPRC